MMAMTLDIDDREQAPAESYAGYQQPDESYAQSDGGGGGAGSGSSAGSSGTTGGGGVGGGVGGAKTGTTQAAQAPAKPKWKASAVIIPKSAFDALKKSMGPDGAGIDFKPTGMKKFLFISGKKKQNLRMGKGLGILIIDENRVSTAFLWTLVKSVVDSGENLAISFAATIQVSQVSLDTNSQIVVKDMQDIMRHAGLTLTSKDLTKKIYGSLLPTGSVLELTSIYDNFSIIYLMSTMANTHTVAHELLGHFYLASKGMPYRHSESVTGTTVLDNKGQPFAGPVDDFIKMVVDESSANVKAAAASKSQGTPAPAPAKP
jgi:hypothetical protein